MQIESVGFGELLHYHLLKHPVTDEILVEKGDLEVSPVVPVGENNPGLKEEKITTRRDGHSRGCERYHGDWRNVSRSVLVARRGFDDWRTYIQEAGSQLHSGSQEAVDWAGLARVNAGWEQPTLASVAKPEVLAFAVKVVCSGLASKMRRFRS